MYSILIQDKKNNSHFSFLQVRKEIMKETTEKVDDGSGNMVEKTVYTPTGQFENVVYEDEDRDEFEKKCTELLKTYNLNELRFIDNLRYGVDLIREVSH